MLKQRPQSLYYRSTNILKVSGLSYQIPGGTLTYINDATVEVVMHSNGVEVASEICEWPLELFYVTESNGDYACNIPHDLDVKVNGLYHLDVVASAVVAGITVQRYWSLPVMIIVDTN